MMQQQMTCFKVIRKENKLFLKILMIKQNRNCVKMIRKESKMICEI